MTARKPVKAINGNVTKPKCSNQTNSHGTLTSHTPASRFGKRSRNQWYADIVPPIRASGTVIFQMLLVRRISVMIRMIASGYIMKR